MFSSAMISVGSQQVGTYFQSQNPQKTKQKKPPPINVLDCFSQFSSPVSDADARSGHQVLCLINYFPLISLIFYPFIILSPIFVVLDYYCYFLNT